MAALASVPRTESVRTHWHLGALSSIVGALISTVITFGIYIRDWKALLAAQLAAGRPDEAVIVTYILSGLNDLIIVGGVIWAVAAWGFAQRARWAWSAGVIAAVTTLVGSFFWTIPAMSKGVFPTYMAIFMPNLLLYLVLLIWVKPVDRRVVVLSLFTGITYVLSFMNGVAATSHILTDGTAVFAATQRLNWGASAMWAVMTVGLVHKKDWAWPLGIAAAVMELVGGSPLAYVSTLEEGRFSLFTPAPLLSLVLLLLILSPKITAWYRHYCNGQD